MTTREAPLAESPRAFTRAVAALDAVCEALAADRPLWLILTGSLLLAYIWCAWLFDAGFLLGISSYWSTPRGLVGHSWDDISTALSGDFYFQRDTWHIPLFYVDKLGAPEGTNVIFSGTIPWVALAGRLMFRATGVPVNLYGLWTAGCLVASAVTLTALVAKLGQRNLAAAAMATVSGLCMPELLYRWGHLSLMAQFEIPLALIFYLSNRRRDEGWKLFMKAAELTVLALWTNNYMFVMVEIITFATIAQAVSDRALGWRTAGAVLAGLSVVIGGVMALSGHLQSRGGFSSGVDNPFFPLNLLSPFMPQRSGLFAPLRDTLVDVTGRQYEGFSYLGAGVLVLLIATLPRQMSTLWLGLRRHPWLWFCFLGFTLFALSNAIYFGTVTVLYVPLPSRIIEAASMFRSTGRFIWPILYCVNALAIAAAIPFHGRRGVLLLCAAALLQWIDSAPLREDLATITRAPERSHIDLAAWRAAISRHRSVRVLPQYACLPEPLLWNSQVAAQLELLAAAADRPINSVYAARRMANCDADNLIDGTPQPGARQLSVFFGPFPGFARMRALAASGGECRSGPGLVVCSDIPEEAPTLAALAWTDWR